MKQAICQLRFYIKVASSFPAWQSDLYSSMQQINMWHQPFEIISSVVRLPNSISVKLTKSFQQNQKHMSSYPDIPGKSIKILLKQSSAPCWVYTNLILLSMRRWWWILSRGKHLRLISPHYYTNTQLYRNTQIHSFTNTQIQHFNSVVCRVDDGFYLGVNICVSDITTLLTTRKCCQSQEQTHIWALGIVLYYLLDFVLFFLVSSKSDKM